MQTLPEITISDWLNAEQSCVSYAPQPKGTVTTDQYAKLMNINRAKAYYRLKRLVQNEKAEQLWIDHKTSVFRLKKDKKQ